MKSHALSYIASPGNASNVSIVKTSSAPFVTTAAPDMMAKTVCHVPMSCAPPGRTRWYMLTSFHASTRSCR